MLQACLEIYGLGKFKGEPHPAALAGLRTLITTYSAAITMIRLPSPAGEHGSVSEGVSPAEQTSRPETVVERNFLHEQRSSRNRPCDACRRRKSRCVLNDGAARCVLCEFHAQECTFVERIPPRKRRYTGCEDELDRWLSTCHSTDTRLTQCLQTFPGYCAQEALGKKRTVQEPGHRRRGLCRSQGTDSFETDVRSSTPTSWPLRWLERQIRTAPEIKSAKRSQCQDAK